MMDIVVHNSYKNEFDAVDRKSENDVSDDESDIEEIENKNLANQDRIQNDLEELAMEQLNASNGDDDNALLERWQPRSLGTRGCHLSP